MTATTVPQPSAPSVRKRIIKVVLLVVVLALVAMWVYAFGFAPREGVNLVRDDAWAAGAKAACTTATQELEPLAFTRKIETDADLAAFAAGLDPAFAVLDKMLDTIEAVPRTSTKAQEVVPMWLAEYRTYVQDLRDWGAEMKAGNRAKLSVSKTEGNIPIDERINTFATENRIKECSTNRLES